MNVGKHGVWHLVFLERHTWYESRVAERRGLHKSSREHRGNGRMMLLQ